MFKSKTWSIVASQVLCFHKQVSTSHENAIFTMKWVMLTGKKCRLVGMRVMKQMRQTVGNRWNLDYRPHNIKKWTRHKICFTHKTVRFWLAKLVDIWIDHKSCSSWIQNLKIPLKLSSFAFETNSIFLDFFSVVCCPKISIK